MAHRFADSLLHHHDRTLTVDLGQFHCTLPEDPQVCRWILAQRTTIKSFRAPADAPTQTHILLFCSSGSCVIKCSSTTLDVVAESVTAAMLLIQPDYQATVCRVAFWYKEPHFRTFSRIAIWKTNKTNIFWEDLTI